MDLIQTNALTGQNISSPLLAATYTADQDRELLVAVSLSGLSGGGTYLACLTHQIGGAGAFHQSPTGQFALAAGVTTLRVQAGALAVGAGDVVRAYVQGLVADVNAEVTTEVFDVTAATAGDVVATLSVSATEALTVATGSMALTLWSSFDQTVESDSMEDLAAADALIWAIKLDRKRDIDAEALVLVDVTTGLRYLARAAYTGSAANGSVTVSGTPGDWEIRCQLAKGIPGLLAAWANRNLDAQLKAIFGGRTVNLGAGTARIGHQTIREV
jgi:hypothetical protein